MGGGAVETGEAYKYSMKLESLVSGRRQGGISFVVKSHFALRNMLSVAANIKVIPVSTYLLLNIPHQ